jgi:DNA polymerase elongation subunit (family B)
VLIDTQYLINTRKLVVSYVDKTGDIKLKYYDWQTPLKYVTCEDNDTQRHPDYKSWDNKNVKQIEVNHPDRYAVYEFLDALPDKEKEEIFEFNLPKIFFIDIETEIIDGFPEAADIKDPNGNVIKEGAATQVLSISIVYDDKIILLGLKEMPQDMQDRILNNTNKYFEKSKVEYKFKYIKYEDEFDMMYNFFYKMVPKMPLITGWNFLNYDWLYLVNRCRKLSKWVNGKEIKIDPAVSSFTKRMNKVWSTEYEVPAHRMIFDYMQLYEICDTSIKVKESSSLDFVSNKLVGVDKIKYTGSLQKLYEDDFETFMYYNAVDSVLVQKIHDARNYISIIFAISALAKIRVVDIVSQMNNALGSLAITEGVLRNRFRDMENIILFKDENAVRGNESGIAGGWVKDPVVGMNKWVVIYDFASLYPTTMLQFYIAPETFIGVKTEEEDEYCFNGNQRIKIDSDKHVVCINGVVFEKRLSPTLRMIEDVYLDRKTNKKIMMQKKEEYKAVMDEIKQLESEL